MKPTSPPLFRPSSAILLGAAASLLAITACRKEEAPVPGKSKPPIAVASAAPTPPPGPPAAAPTAAPVAVFDVLTAPGFGEPALVELVPRLPAHEPGMMDHAFVAGWSKDSKEFGYCVVSGGSGGTRCEFVTPAGATEKLNDYDDAKGESDEVRHAALLARVSSRGYSSTPSAWPYARDLLLTWKSEPRVETRDRVTQPRFLVGAKLRDQSAFSAALTMAPPSTTGQDWFDIHPETIAVSPDGKYLGVVSHSFAGEFSDTFGIRILATSVLAGQAFNEQGLILHRARRSAEAVRWFHQAAHANPESKVAFYNLACALARSGSSRVEVALRRAIEAGGPEVKQKAGKDEDFSAVRNEGWFRALTAS